MWTQFLEFHASKNNGTFDLHLSICQYVENLFVIMYFILNKRYLNIVWACYVQLATCSVFTAGNHAPQETATPTEVQELWGECLYWPLYWYLYKKYMNLH